MQSMFSRNYNLLKNKFYQISNKNVKDRSFISAQTFLDKEFFSLFDYNKIKGLKDESNSFVGKEIILNYYKNKLKNEWIQPPPILTDLRVKLYELNQKSIIDLADDITEKKLLIDKTKPLYNGNGNIKWHFNPMSSNEWIWRLHRHQWWPLLG